MQDRTAVIEELGRLIREEGEHRGIGDLMFEVTFDFDGDSFKCKIWRSSDGAKYDPYTFLISLEIWNDRARGVKLYRTIEWGLSQLAARQDRVRHV